MPDHRPGWAESHLLLAALDRAAVVVSASIQPSRRRAEHLGVVWPWDGQPVVMVEDDVPIPADRWEFRSHGLWVEQVCEAPLDHWTYGLESFALELDHGDELVHTGRGTRVPLGWELEFEAEGPARWLLTESAPLEEAGCYTQPGSLHGLLLDGRGAWPVTGRGQRWHWWGTQPLASAGIRIGPPPDDRDQEVLVPLSDGPIAIGRAPGAVTLERRATVDSDGSRRSRR